MSTTNIVDEIRAGRKDLVLASLSDVNLRGADLRCANLWNADLCNADLRGADLRGAYLRGANLWGANLSSADLRCANLWNADLCNADLRNANLDQCNLSVSVGLNWSQVGSIGTDRRTITAAVLDAGITIFAGCFTGTPQEFRQRCNEGGKGWDWPEDYGHLRDECLEALDYVVAKVNRQAVEA